jgi:type VI protein secretion system component VasK
MLKKLQKQPLSVRKKILIIGVSAAVILIVPLWILTFQRTLRQKPAKEASRKTNLAEPNLIEIKDEFKSAIEEFKAILDQMQNIDQLKDQSPANLKLPENN